MADDLLKSLLVQLKLGADTFNNDLKQSQRELKSFETSIKPSTTAAKELGTTMTAAGGAIVGAMLLATKSVVDYADNLNDLRQKTGVGVENLARLGFAAEQSGSSMDGLVTGLKFLSKNMEAAVSGSKQQQQAFGALGLSSKDLAANHGDVNKVFLQLADRFKELPDGAEKSALAMNVFGKAGVDLIPILNEGSSGIQQLGDNAAAAGKVISQDFASASDNLNDTIHEAEAAVGGLSLGVATALLPAMQAAAEIVRDGIVAFADFVKQHQTLTQVVFALGVALAGSGGLLLALAGVMAILPSIVAAWGLLNTVFAISPIGAVITAIAALVAGIVIFRDEIGGGMAKALGFMLNGLADIVDAAYRAAGALGLTGLADALSTAGNYIRETSAHFTEMGKTLLDNDTKVKELTHDQMEMQSALGMVVAAMDAEHAQHVKNVEAIAKHNEAVKNIVDAFKKEEDSSSVLVDALKQLEAAHYSPILIAEKLGKTALDTAHALETNGNAVPPIISKYVDLAQALDLANGKLFTDADLLKASASAVDSLRTAMSLIKKLPEDTFEVPPPELPETFSADYIASLNRAVAAANTAAESVAQTQGIELARVLKDNQKQLDDAVKDVKESAGKIFDDMFIKGESVFSSLQNALKGGALSLGRSIFEDVTGALLGPVKKAFDDFFASIIESIGLKQLGTAIGGAISGALGIGGAAGGGAAAGAGGGAAAGGAALGISGTTLAVTGGIAAAVLAAVGWIKSQAHWEANTFVNQLQNPLGGALANISGTVSERLALGVERPTDIQAAIKGINDLWASFQDAAHAFAAGGSDEAKVAAQGLATVGPVVNALLSSLNQNLNDLVSSQVTAAAIVQYNVLGEVIRSVTPTVGSLGVAVAAVGHAMAATIDSLQEGSSAIINYSTAAPIGTPNTNPNALYTAGGQVIGTGVPDLSDHHVADTSAYDYFSQNPNLAAAFGANPAIPNPYEVAQSYTGIQIAPTVGHLADTSSITTTNNGYAAGIDPLTGRPLTGYATGTNYVPRTAIYQLHRGEAVIPADKNRGGQDSGGGGGMMQPIILQIDRTEIGQVLVPIFYEASRNYGMQIVAQ